MHTHEHTQEGVTSFLMALFRSIIRTARGTCTFQQMKSRMSKKPGEEGAQLCFQREDLHPIPICLLFQGLQSPNEQPTSKTRLLTVIRTCYSQMTHNSRAPFSHEESRRARVSSHRLQRHNRTLRFKGSPHCPILSWRES